MKNSGWLTDPDFKCKTGGACCVLLLRFFAAALAISSAFSSIMLSAGVEPKAIGAGIANWGWIADVVVEFEGNPDWKEFGTWYNCAGYCCGIWICGWNVWGGAMVFVVVVWNEGCVAGVEGIDGVDGIWNWDDGVDGTWNWEDGVAGIPPLVEFFEDLFNRLSNSERTSCAAFSINFPKKNQNKKKKK